MGRAPSGGQTLYRQWHMLRHIPRVPRKVSVRELSGRLASEGFSVSDRTIQRDLHELSTCFPLVADETDKPFGWSFSADAAVLDLPNLTSQEALALVMLDRVGSFLLPDSMVEGLAGHIRTARKRLAETAAGRWLDKVRVIDPALRLSPPRIAHGVHRAITDGLLADRRVRIRYRPRGADTAADYVVSPLALIQRGPIAYLVGTLFDYTDPRLLAMHRIERAEADDGKVKRPRDFDVDAFLAAGRLDFGSGGSIALTASFSKSVAEHLFEAKLSGDQCIELMNDGRVRVVATVPDTPQVRWWLLGFGAEVEVLGPATLRAEIANEAAAMAATYARKRGRSLK